MSFKKTTHTNVPPYTTHPRPSFCAPLCHNPCECEDPPPLSLRKRESSVNDSAFWGHQRPAKIRSLCPGYPIRVGHDDRGASPPVKKTTTCNASPAVILANALDPGNMNTVFLPLTPHQNKDSLSWTLGPSPRVTTEGEPPFVTSCPGRQHTPGGHPCVCEDPAALIPLFRDIDAPAPKRNPPPMTPPGRHPCESEDPGNMNTVFLPLTLRQNKDSLPWTLGPSPRVTVEKSPGR